MANNLANFTFDDKEVRTMLIDGEVWFVAMDIARILEYGQTVKMLALLEDYEVKKIAGADLAPAKNLSPMAREITLVNESGLYSAVISSTKPKAKEFKKWVTNEVLPKIRKKGFYSSSKYVSDIVEYLLERLPNPQRLFTVTLEIYDRNIEKTYKLRYQVENGGIRPPEGEEFVEDEKLDGLLRTKYPSKRKL